MRFFSTPATRSTRRLRPWVLVVAAGLTAILVPALSGCDKAMPVSTNTSVAASSSGTTLTEACPEPAKAISVTQTTSALSQHERIMKEQSTYRVVYILSDGRTFNSEDMAAMSEYAVAVSPLLYEQSSLVDLYTSSIETGDPDDAIPELRKAMEDQYALWLALSKMSVPTFWREFHDGITQAAELFHEGVRDIADAAENEDLDLKSQGFRTYAEASCDWTSALQLEDELIGLLDSGREVVRE